MKFKYIIYSSLVLGLCSILLYYYAWPHKPQNGIKSKGLVKSTTAGKINPQAITIHIQPFNDISPTIISHILKELKAIYPHIILKPPITLPALAYYPARQRYRADSLIAYLADRTSEGFVTIGLCSHDISTTKDNIKDWGVMGLGYQPGKACMVSTFRLKKDSVQNELFKVSIHELGHTQGLPHCEEKRCFMRDAEGGNPTDDEKDFCPNCKQLLKSKGWIFPS